MITFWPQLFTFCMFILAWLFWMDYKKHIRWVRVLTGWYWGNRAPNQVKKCVLLIFFFVEIVDISSNYLWKNMFLSSFSFDFLYLFLHRKSPWSISFSPILVFIYVLLLFLPFQSRKAWHQISRQIRLFFCLTDVTFIDFITFA